MSNINVYELTAAGSDLFQDSESFLNELKDVDFVAGGDSSGQYGNASMSDMSFLTKLAEAFVATYAIGHITYLAKSFSYEY
ncbi:MULTISPECIES: hypothetical protein [unclassified Anabaena]|uniref:hypothetical protein n=1 Tax=unclassified Anabaena TaxID=2619674 RepID=UPI0039C5D399